MTAEPDPVLPGLEPYAAEPDPTPPANRGALAVERHARALIDDYNRGRTELGRIRRGPALTMVRTALLEAGYHPATRLPLSELEGTSCGTCALRLERGRYLKCTRASVTRSQESDLRRSWPGCELWTADEEGAP